MNVLFVMPRVTSSPDEWYVFPTGIAYVSSALKNNARCNVFTSNLNYSDNIYQTISKLIKQHQIDVVASGGLAFQYGALKEIMSIAKCINESIITIMGGAYISGDPIVGMSAIPEIDIGIIGEGEITICELINELNKANSNLKQVDGIIFKNTDGEYEITKQRNPIQDIDSIAYPDYDGFEFERTLDLSPVNFGIYGTHSAVLLTSRGCPFNCSFCFHPQGDKYRRRSIDSIFRELDWLQSKYTINSILFLDELFGGNNEWLKEFCRRIKQYDLKWWVETRVEFATTDNLKLMKDSGCVQVLFGIENINDSILESMRKKTTKAQIEIALKNAYDIGISSPGMLLFGDPVETKETAKNTIEWWKEHSMYNIILTTVQVYPGSYLWEFAKKKGILPDIKSCVEFIQNGCPKINLTSMSNTDYTELCKQISICNKSNNPFIIQATAHNKKWKGSKVIADVTGFCSRCGSKNIWNNVNIVSEGGGAECFICKECGQSHSNSFFDYYYSVAKQNLLDLFSKYNSMAVLGQSRHYVQIYNKCKEIQELDIKHFTSSPSKVGEMFFDKELLPFSSFKDSNIKVLVLAVGDVHYLATLDNVKNDIDNCVVYTLTDLMNDNLKI